jgi:ribonuclease BN (tRNA processing enzyme)
MGELDLTFIGSGNAFAPGGLCWNGFVLNRKYLFEAPPQSLMSLHQVEIDPNTIEAVILSHHHGDHFLGMPSLLLHWKYEGRTAPLKIVGPPETQKLTELIGETVYPGLMDVDFDIAWVVARPGNCFKLGGIMLEAVEAEHDERLVMSLGYHCYVNGRKLGYTGDSKMCDGVLDLARASEVLVSECASRDGNIPVHMNLVDDIPVVRKAMPGESELILTHITPDVTADHLPHSRIAVDYESYSF